MPISATPFLLIAAITAAMVGFVAVVIHLCFTRNDRAAMAAAFAIGFVLTPGIALAGDGPGHAVTLPQALVTTVIEILLVAVTAGLGWLIRKGSAYLHVSTESLLVQRLERGMEAALAHARQELLARGKDPLSLPVRNEGVALAANYLLPKMPDTLKALGIDAAGLHQRLAARALQLVPLTPVTLTGTGGPAGLSYDA